MATTEKKVCDMRQDLYSDSSRYSYDFHELAWKAYGQVSQV